MKSLMTLTILSLSLSLSAAELNLSCDVVTLHDDNVFEEGLGETGLSDVDADAQSVTAEFSERAQSISIGQHTFSSKNKNVRLTSKETETEVTLTAQMLNVQTVKLKVFKSSSKGVVLQKELRHSAFKAVAEIDCNDYSKIKAMIISGKVASKQLKRSEVPSKVLNKISQIDVPFEMGDGYYDLKFEKIQELSSAGTVVGYVLESHLSYTEGDDVVAETYFLANGVRFSGPN